METIVKAQSLRDNPVTLLLRPPAIPDDLIKQFGEPEEVFGPNRRFRVVSAICGLVLIAMAVVFFLMSVGPNAVPLARGVNLMLSPGLLLLGALCLFAPRTVLASWIFVCPGGVIRRRGSTWESIGWDQVVRFEDATIQSGVTTRQCRLVLKQGRDWGFIADWIGGYRKLTDVLRTKVEEHADDSRSNESA